jgi:hypothetical protein
MASRRRRGLQTMLAMLRERKTSHQQLASSVLHWRAEELRTTKHLPWNVGRQGAHSPTRRATASAKRRTRSSTPGRRSGLSLEAGTSPGSACWLPGVLRVIGPKRARVRVVCEHGLDHAPEATENPLVLLVQAWLGRGRLSAQDYCRGTSWIPRAAHLRWPDSEHRVCARSHRARKCLCGSSGRHS